MANVTKRVYEKRTVGGLGFSFIVSSCRVYGKVVFVCFYDRIGNILFLVAAMNY